MDSAVAEIIDITRQAGAIARSHFRQLTPDEVFHKSAVDMVTRIDKELEVFLRDRLQRAFPGVGFYGEEGDYGALSDDDDVFVVDPLDGTTSFIHGHPFYSVSVALRHRGKSKIGVVYLPYFDHVYWAHRKHGAYCGEERLSVSSTGELIESLAATGFACVRARSQETNLPLFTEMIQYIRGIRRCGSAAIDLCYVAAGIYDLYWEYNLKPWDVAAGTLIVEEAGGKVTDFAGEPYKDSGLQFAASNARVHDEFVAVARKFAVASRYRSETDQGVCSSDSV